MRKVALQHDSGKDLAKMEKIIRTPSKAAGGITAKEKILMDKHSRLWTNRILRTEPIDVVAITSAIEDLYRVANLPKPIVVVVPSPLVMAFVFGAAASIWNKRIALPKAATLAATGATTRRATRAATQAATGAATQAATLAATDAATYAATDAATYAATDAATHAATYAATRAATWAATGAAMRAATWAATGAATDAAVRAAATDATTLVAMAGAVKACYELGGKEGLLNAKKWVSNYQGGNMWGYYDCYLTAMRDIIGLKLKEHASYEAWERATIHGGFRVLHRKFCVVSDFPVVLKVDERNLPHCSNGPSHQWRDGWALYHWHGVRVPEQWIINPNSLTVAEAISWPNMEQRRAACEIIGWARILRELDAKTLDIHSDPNVGELIEVALPNVGLARFVRVLCGTRREFVIPVPPEMRSALEAQAWMGGPEDHTAFLEGKFLHPGTRT